MMNIDSIPNKCQLIRDSSAWVMSKASHVKINQQNISSIAEKFHYKKFNEYLHHDVGADDEVILQYLFVLDSCNFCFWPLEGFEYEQLAGSIRKHIIKLNSSASGEKPIENGKGSFRTALQKLSNISEKQLIEEMFGGVVVPLADQRARIIREVISTVVGKFDSSFVGLVKSAQNSAVRLLNILTAHFPNFQDHQIYKGHQIHFYKRAQILIAGIWGRYQGKDLGAFADIDQITMFADYRVPQILNQYGVLTYSEELGTKISLKKEIPSGSQEELEIRAATILAVEEIKKHINQEMKVEAFTLEVDHFLWQLGESMLGKGIVEHHRTLTIFY